ncbi:unnamed protein product [Ambrosiozyma monospora]|uniref:Unnamed protein product n=1 Tax=Ambrosiozyma monospora TaxID=43982 RepID=A0ACB5TJF8_AMBMO|nr:unnamed protein product [Ambrosiozyma monospora]
MSELGVDLFKVNAVTAPSIVNVSTLCFLFAPAFHHGMGVVAPLRKQLGVPTIFNILGPLLNPMPITARILGVYTAKLGKVYCEAAVKLDQIFVNDPKSGSDSVADTMVVCGEVGLDEISPIGKTKVWRYNKKTNKIDEFEIQPSDFGLAEHGLDLVRSGTAKENAVVLKKILNGDVDLDSGDALVDYILINTSALAVIAGVAKDWKHGVELAKESIKSGAAWNALQKFITAINENT